MTTPLDREAAQRCIDATATLNGLSIEGNNYKTTQLLSLREHLTAALAALEAEADAEIELAVCPHCFYVNEAVPPHIKHNIVPHQEGDKWCALLGENIQDGTAGFGDTPGQALLAFDHAMTTE